MQPPKSISATWLLRAALFSAILSLPACSSSEGPPPVGVDGQPIEPIEKRLAAQVEWNKKAAAILPKIVSEKTADVHSEALIALVRERDALYFAARKDKTWEWPQEKKDALEQQFGEDIKTTSAKYHDALKPFDEGGRRANLVTFISNKYGIDIVKMRNVDKNADKVAGE